LYFNRGFRGLHGLEKLKIATKKHENKPIIPMGTGEHELTLIMFSIVFFRDFVIMSLLWLKRPDFVRVSACLPLLAGVVPPNFVHIIPKFAYFSIKNKFFVLCVTVPEFLR
jgi:hypothetical protein